MSRAVVVRIRNMWAERGSRMAQVVLDELTLELFGGPAREEKRVRIERNPRGAWRIEPATSGIGYAAVYRRGKYVGDICEGGFKALTGFKAEGRFSVRVL